jgi:leukotriene-A4 hydrolase
MKLLPARAALAATLLVATAATLLTASKVLPVGDRPQVAAAASHFLPSGDRPRVAGTEAINAADPDSYARPTEARVTDVALDLTADFDARRLRGTARLTIARSPQAREIVLDTNDLLIQAVTDDDGRPLDYTLGAGDRIHGQPLTVTLPSTSRVVVRYETTPHSVALQWLLPAQTAARTHPYVYSQGEAILTRGWIPTQDSPGIRQTYSARIVVPRGLTVVMSAEALSPGGADVPGGRAFSFRLDRPIPPYLFAIAIGDIAFRELGPRTGVYAEPSVLEAAAWEFADLEKMLGAAEALYGPYRWGRYDLLVLPPSFPYGGMENPRLTFMSPTVIAGDRSLTSVAAHELAHSWSGNMVTNATWADMWLNEGFTTYIEQRIIEQLYGQDAAAAVEAIERQDLLALMAEHPEGTRLHETGLADPNDAGGAAYGKGSAFLHLLERAAGRPRFDAWLRSYFDRHAFTSITTAQFAEDLHELFGPEATRMEGRLRVPEWLYQPGLPSNAPVFSSTALERARHEASRFADGTPASALATAGWTTQQWLQFLAALPDSVTRERLGELDRATTLTTRRNSEVLAAWLHLALAHEYEPAVPAAERFLTTQGRLKFLELVYGSLAKTAWGRPIARSIYAVARPLYHSVAQSEMDGLIKTAN